MTKAPKVEKWGHLDLLSKSTVKLAWIIISFGVLNGMIYGFMNNWIMMVINLIPVLLGYKIIASHDKWEEKKNEQNRKLKR